MKNNKFIIYFILILGQLISINLLGQDKNNFVPVKLNNYTWLDFKNETEKNFYAKYYIQTDTIPEFRVKVESDSLTI